MDVKIEAEKVVEFTKDRLEQALESFARDAERLSVSLARAAKNALDRKTSVRDSSVPSYTVDATINAPALAGLAQDAAKIGQLEEQYQLVLNLWIKIEAS